MRDDDFEWDDRKSARNQARHKISFAAARDVFGAPYRVEWEDEGKGGWEQRFIALGMAGARVLYVSYTMRGEAVRILSARLAEPWERRRYFIGG